MSFLMQARSTTTGLLVAWLASTPDFAGVGFPGPGLPEYIAVSALVSEGAGGSLTAPVSPTDNGKFPQAQSGDLTYITATELTADLNLFSDTLKGLTPASGGGTSNFLRADGSWAPPVHLPTSGGDDYKVALGLSGDLAFAANLKVGSAGDSLLFGSTPATTGTLRLPQSSSLYARNSGNTADLPLLRMGAIANTLVLGGGTEGIVGVNIDTTSGSIKLRVANADEYTFSATVADFTNNSLKFGTNPAASGTIRFPSNTVLLAARNAANTADVVALSVDASNVVVLGGAGTPNATRVYANATTNFTAAINGTDEYVFSGTFADFKDNWLQFATNPAASGLLRVPNNSDILVARNAANTGDLRLLRVNTNNEFVLGQSGSNGRLFLLATNDITLQPGGSDEFVFTPTYASFADNWLQFGTTPAASGLVRVPANVGNIIASRNYDGTGDQTVLAISGDGSTFQDLRLGDSSTKGNSTLYAQAKTQLVISLAAANAYTFGTSTADFGSKRLQFGTNTASSGLVGVPHASNVLFGRNNANTQNSPLIRWGNVSPLSGTDILYFGSAAGDAGKVANMRWGIDTGGGYQWEVNSTAIATLDAGAFSLPAGQYLSFGSAALSIPPATAGMVRMPNTATIYRRNAANTQDIRFVNMSDDLTLGDIFQGGSLYLDVPTGQSHSLRVNGTSKLSVDTNGITTVALAAVTAQTTSSTASAGAAAALPNSPQGYIVVTINGTSRKIPYYPT